MARTKSIIVALIISGQALSFEPVSVSPGFNVNKVASLTESLPSHSWEYGAAAQALLELYNPQLSVFGADPFTVPSTGKSGVKALSYAVQKITLGQGVNSLANGDGATGDPASLGVSAVMLGKAPGGKQYADAATNTALYLIYSAPRSPKGAISHRISKAEFWSDFVYMVPPFLAYYAVDRANETLLRESVQQCGYYREILRSNGGAWKHIVGPESQDDGLWSTGNGWAAAGMARVLATVMKAPEALTSTWRKDAIRDLTSWIMEILSAVVTSQLDDGLVPNYLDATHPTAHRFGEISGSALVASVIYRMAVLQPESCGQDYISWADKIRRKLSGKDKNGQPHVAEDGVVKPSVNPLNWLDTKLFTSGSPEGQAFVVLMYAAWRDCVSAGTCKQLGARASHRMHRRRFSMF